MKEIKAILRKECVQDVVLALRAAGVPRLTICHVHALGSGVDPDHFRLSFEEGSAYMEKTRLELVCEEQQVQECIDLIRAHACTGHRGDGVVFVSAVERVVKTQTGAEDERALA